MEIKDTLSLFDFLGKLNLFGALVFTFILSVLIGYLVASVADKLYEQNRKKAVRTVIFLVVGSFWIAMFIISLQARSNREKIDYANSIKAFMVSQKLKYMGFREAASKISLSSSKIALNTPNHDFDDRVSTIKDVIDNFPEEFEIVPIQNDDKRDSIGIELIDTTATKRINSYFDNIIPFVFAKISHYRPTQRTDTLTYYQIRTEIDPRFQNDVIDKLISVYPMQLRPINLYDSTGNFSDYALVRLKDQ